MKITFALPGFLWFPSGGFKVVYSYANYLTERGHEVYVVHPKKVRLILRGTNLQDKIRDLGLRVLTAVLGPRLTWFPIDRRVRMLHVPELTESYMPDADAVFATSWQTAEYVLQYPSNKGDKFYLVMDFAPWHGPKDQLEETWRWPLKKVAICNWLEQEIVRVGGSKATSVPIGINQQAYRLTEDISRRTKSVIMMYSRSNYKGIEDGIKALEIVKQNPKHADLEVFLFGTPFNLICNAFRLPGWMKRKMNPSDEALAQLYNRSRISLCSSLAEGFALPPAEAMACGCAVVATDCGGISEYAIHEENALLSPPSDPEKLAANIIRLLEDDDLRIRVAQAGHRAIQKFTWDRSAELMEACLKRSQEQW